ncbi:hypothetical protein CEXT_352151 [Caerostris extrusa]|uniref:C2H2-type domain-containing protein n=1 Tax=Caerostris extrusa TaxID=172846 RepID=A0AAV4WL50_CAEEX|nr:hypothetical protein CEXT_352151 [Caerostris extrusa]
MPTEHNHDSDGAEVTLFPSASEVSELLSPHCTRPKFNFIKLVCHQCSRRFFSAGGLERHLFAVHGINLNSHDDLPPTSAHSSHVVDPPEELLRHGMSTGPPSCAPFTKIGPAKSWAAIVAKPAISTTQPWAGLPLTPHTSFSSTPRSPGQTRPTQADGSAAKGGSPHNALPPVQRVRKKITFKNDSEDLDAVSHVVLFPQRQIKKRRRNFPCLHCDFTFRTMKSRDDHNVVHVLEEQLRIINTQ